MYKNVLQNIENIQIWPMISFVIFFIFFLCLLLWVFSTDKNFINKMSGLPMEEENNKINSSANTVEP
jgi:cytochrome c oxidase cbb3-type subunit 4